MPAVPAVRCTAVNDRPVRRDGDFVLYWMIAARRTRWNFAFDRAVHWAVELEKPLVILEALRVGYPWASDRIHKFILEGMADNAASLAERRVLYYPYVEPEPDAGKGLLRELGSRAAVVVTDEFPCFMFPGMVRAAAGQVPVRLEQVDGNGLLPLRVSDRAFPTAYAFRRHHQKMLPEHLEHRPRGNPLARTNLPEPVRLPRAITRRWPPATPDVLAGKSLHRLPIDHAVPPVVDVPGGEAAAGRALRRFLERGLNRYAADHHRPQEPASSGLSPYLHFGHVSAHEVFDALARRESWDPGKLSRKTDGKQTGRWGMSAGAESFLNQLVTWRELGYTMTFHRGDHAEYASLPTWARRTLEAHAGDTRPHLYGLEEFESGRTHDPLWNAAQGELVVKGRIHNYLRMLWGKKILEWSSSPRAALAVMIELNNKYGLDGRNPNSYSGIFWVLGRYDRPWGPERPILGKIRYMSSRNTARKVRVSEYVATFAPSGGAAP